MKQNILIALVASLGLLMAQPNAAVENGEWRVEHTTRKPNTLRVAVLIPTPQMHCENCENKIKKNMRFERGVKHIDTDLESQHVTITYDSKKASVKSLQEGMKKIGYETKVVSDLAAKKQ